MRDEIECRKGKTEWGAKLSLGQISAAREEAGKLGVAVKKITIKEEN